MRRNVKDITDQKFGKLIVISFAETRNHHNYWNCLCDCGTKKAVRGDRLRSGNTISCGCAKKGRHETHGLTSGGKNRRLFNCWSNMLHRCYDPRYKGNKHYMDRGITVCDEWKESFAPFYEWSIANGYDAKLTLDRRDNDKGYSPDNCRWATYTQQNRNRSFNVLDEDKVRQIRRLSVTKKCANIAELLDAHVDTVRRVVKGVTWKNVT